MVRKGYTEVSCRVCNKKFEKRSIDVIRYPNHCCSVECRSKNNDKTIAVRCSQCGLGLRKPPSLLKGKKNVFCSEACANKFQTTKVDVVCPICGKIFRQHLCIIKRARHGFNFCSTECRSKHVFKKSYVETLFEGMLANLSVKYDRNNRTEISPMELDFWFPDLRYAVEINGACHYKPLYGEEVLAAQKVRDRKKRKLCKEKGITLRSVRVERPGDGTFERRLRRVIWELKRVTDDRKSTRIASGLG